MKIGVYQFQGSSNIIKNHEAIIRGIIGAAQNNVRLLVFQECAACGYPPVETLAVEKINFELLNFCLQQIKKLATKYDMYIALGTIRKEDFNFYNSLILINPNGEIMGSYDKRALWGWDLENFKKGNGQGIFNIDDIQIGFRICYEVRFPEYFRELFKSKVQICFMIFCDVSEQESIERYNIIKAHLVTRAVENVMTVISVNSISKYQTAPTAVIDSEGFIVSEAPRNQEHLMVYEYNAPEIGFGAEGRVHNAMELLGEIK